MGMISTTSAVRVNRSLSISTGPTTYWATRLPVAGYDGGPDDNFYLKAYSPAIDRADAWAAPADRH